MADEIEICIRACRYMAQMARETEMHALHANDVDVALESSTRSRVWEEAAKMFETLLAKSAAAVE